MGLVWVRVPSLADAFDGTPPGTCKGATDKGRAHAEGGRDGMNVIVLKVRGRENLEELDGVIQRGQTRGGGLGDWQMPKDAQLGDLAVWYATSPHQEYRAYGWVAEVPRKPPGQASKYYGSVAGVRSLVPASRKAVAAASGFNEAGVGQLAQTVPAPVDDFLLAVGFDRRFVEAITAMAEVIPASVRAIMLEELRQGIDKMSTKVSRTGLAGLSPRQLIVLALVWIFILGGPVAQSALPPEAQSVLTDEYATFGLALIITWRMLDKRGR
jgi:hypothetical protein